MCRQVGALTVELLDVRDVVVDLTPAWRCAARWSSRARWQAASAAACASSSCSRPRTTAGSDSTRACCACAGTVAPWMQSVVSKTREHDCTAHEPSHWRQHRKTQATSATPGTTQRGEQFGKRPVASASVTWERHLPEGMHDDDLDLLGACSLPAAWATRWAAARSTRSSTTGRGGSPQPSSRTGHARSPGGWPGPGSSRGTGSSSSAEASLELVVAHVAALRLGLVVVPANGAYRDARSPTSCGDAAPRPPIVDDTERGEWISRRRSRRVLDLEPASSCPTEMPPPLDAAHARRARAARLHLGHHRPPKGALLTHGNLLASVESLRLAWRWTADDRLVLALPLFHMHGLGVGLHGTLLAGASAVLLPRFDADAVLDAAPRRHATLFFGVPTMYDAPRRVGPSRRARRGCGCACRARRRCPPSCTRARRRRRRSACSSATA